jgi:DNA-binding beta-propeller fold protein YncE/mono/diheme cytochrome c family protein
MRSTVSPRAHAHRADRPGLHGLARTIAIAGATFGLAAVGAADGPPSPPFLEGASPGGARAASPTPAYLTSSRIAAVDDGALVIDADSGVLARVDAAGATIAQLAVAPEAGLLAYDSVALVAYVADRRGDRIVCVRIGAALEVVRTWRTAAEPYGVALTPDRTTVLVTHVADRALVGYDAASGRERWRTALAAEPRGIAVSPDGRRALVAHLTTGALDEISLDDRKVTHLALPVRSGGARARGAFAVTFLGNDVAVSPFQRATPVPEPGEETSAGHYGGAERPPITQHLALLGLAGRRRATAAELGVHMPRAVAWDGARDALYVAGLADDDIVQVAKASQVDVRPGFSGSVGAREACGPEGLAIASDGNLLVWCSFTRSVARVVVIDGKGQLATRWRTTRGPPIAATTLHDAQHRGMVLFHRADFRLSGLRLACASCHPEGRADGLSWRIERDALQTPILAGRIASTAPYKWSGGARDLPASLRETITRLRGTGLGRRQLAALAAYLEAMPAVRAPSSDATAIARGKEVFETTGCSGCHDGAAYTDRTRHRLARRQPAIDTPSLLGLAASAPYFHDGSAATLDVVLRDRGAVHGMSEPALRLGDREVADLIAFLESL